MRNVQRAKYVKLPIKKVVTLAELETGITGLKAMMDQEFEKSGTVDDNKLALLVQLVAKEASIRAKNAKEKLTQIIIEA